jgi:hypothetical protein
LLFSLWCVCLLLQLAKMVKRPVISIVSQQLFNFENRVSIFVHYYPHRELNRSRVPLSACTAGTKSVYCLCGHSACMCVALVY